MLLAFGLTLAGACAYTIKIKDGPTAYERKQFSVAIPLLENEFGRAKTRPEKAKAAYLLGKSYENTGQYEKALRWFKTAYDNNGGPEALKAHAFTLKKTEQYAAAREDFKNLGIEIGSPYEFRKEVTACTIAEDWLKQAPGSGWTISNVPFNSSNNDFAPVVYPDGRIVFTSDRAIGKGDKIYNWTGREFMDLFIVDADGASPQQFETRLNTGANEGTAAFDKNAREVFFVRSLAAYKGDDAVCKIFFAVRQEDGAWGEPELLPFQKDKINYVHPSLSADGATLYFSCNDPGGWGGFDMYSMNRNSRSEAGWDEPKLLSRNINTPGNEFFPSVDKDTLYFASDGHQGMGGLDVFRTYKADKNTWAPPHNLKAPVNSGADDFAFVVEKNNGFRQGDPVGTLLKTGYFASNRRGGRGADDIYRFELRVPPPPPVRVDTVSRQPLAAKMLLQVYVLEKILEKSDDPNSRVLGRRPLPEAQLRVENNAKKQTKKLPDSGMLEIELAENTDYQFSATLEGYLSNSARFSTKGIAKDPANPVQIFELEIVLDKIYKNQEIVLENIYYDYDKWDIRPDAEPTLNRLADMLKQNPGIRIQLGSHTDCRGNDAYNQELSQRRAQSAVNYLIGKNIDADRLAAIGYGEKQPAADCQCARCSETEHQTNRRTTFKIVE
jgi:peptidoglycan-associated lipoprotein